MIQMVSSIFPPTGKIASRAQETGMRAASAKRGNDAEWLHVNCIRRIAPAGRGIEVRITRVVDGNGMIALLGVNQVAFPGSRGRVEHGVTAGGASAAAAYCNRLGRVGYRCASEPHHHGDR